MPSKKTLLALIVDRSGSMSGVAHSMSEAINGLFAEQKKEPGDCDVLLAQFDTDYEVVEDGPLASVTEYTLLPRGGTALLDAIGKTLATIEERLEPLRKSYRPQVLVAIVTDGHENASREWTRAQVKAKIEELGPKGYEFTYLGANQDSFAEAGSIGIAPGSTMNWFVTDGGSRSMVSAVSSLTTTYRGGGYGPQLTYTEADRKAVSV